MQQAAMFKRQSSRSFLHLSLQVVHFKPIIGSVSGWEACTKEPWPWHLSFTTNKLPSSPKVRLSKVSMSLLVQLVHVPKCPMHQWVPPEIMPQAEQTHSCHSSYLPRKRSLTFGISKWWNKSQISSYLAEELGLWSDVRSSNWIPAISPMSFW